MRFGSWHPPIESPGDAKRLNREAGYVRESSLSALWDLLVNNRPSIRPCGCGICVDCLYIRREYAKVLADEADDRDAAAGRRAWRAMATPIKPEGQPEEAA